MIHSVVDSKPSHLKPATINRYAATMRAILRKAEREWEWLDRVKTLPNHHCLYKSFDVPGAVVRGMPFYELKTLDCINKNVSPVAGIL